MEDVVEFDGFVMRVVLRIADFRTDRNFNNTVVVANKLYYTNGQNLF